MMTQNSGRLSGVCRAAAVTAMAGASLFSLAAPAQAAGDGPNYVAMGDSYASGAGLSGVKDTACDRTAAGYPSIIAGTSAGENRALKDVTCSGATTRHIWNAQGSKPPQINALTPNTKLVTLTIGGNDVGFTGVLTTCVLVKSSDPDGSPCRKHFTTGKDVLGERINTVEGRVRDTITDIRRRSPDAKIVVVGYPALFPDNGVGCAEVPFARQDFAFLRDTTQKLNRALARRAAAGGTGVSYADTYSPTVGYDMCQPRHRRFIESLTPAPGSMAAHPNTYGQLMMATAALDQILEP
ncbi:SGNH/GDSL hydrolase family protein [Streptomyces sp. ALI-76-A]|jgi:lysophospholipase L1-like esterase|uniref:SGNH/GDSL hydrolase family protein n=1 Tax=Streptomyces sp. ALI-76-A TaxID=3025736 RepID=UPI00256F1690|nr:SGNH/GDSL hydrolase family protein [Streptomyces sp. ALI-76-A]MDL5201747.1 SGNH/GDSL hydrolase family protein [Streptomyces sp. ALI-76-A]